MESQNNRNQDPVQVAKNALIQAIDNSAEMSGRMIEILHAGDLREYERGIRAQYELIDRASDNVAVELLSAHYENRSSYDETLHQLNALGYQYSGYPVETYQPFIDTLPVGERIVLREFDEMRKEDTATIARPAVIRLGITQSHKGERIVFPVLQMEYSIAGVKDVAELPVNTHSTSFAVDSLVIGAENIRKYREYSEEDSVPRISKDGIEDLPLLTLENAPILLAAAKQAIRSIMSASFYEKTTRLESLRFFTDRMIALKQFLGEAVMDQFEQKVLSYDQTVHELGKIGLFYTGISERSYGEFNVAQNVVLIKGRTGIPQTTGFGHTRLVPHVDYEAEMIDPALEVAVDRFAEYPPGKVTIISKAGSFPIDQYIVIGKENVANYHLNELRDLGI